MNPRLWWLRPEDIAERPALLALLSDEERAQQIRYLPPAKRHEYLATRVLVRTVMGEVLGHPPESLRFVRNQWGRPSLAPDLLDSPLYFNLSHTEGLVVCLVSTEREVGVDVERFSRAPTVLRLSPRVFATAERAALDALPEAEQGERAITLWTLKESYIKARGMGLALPLGEFAFRIAHGQIALDVEPALNDDGARWQFQCQRLGEHCLSTAVAVDGPHEGRIAIELCEFNAPPAA